MSPDYSQMYPGRIDTKEMAELCHTIPRNVRIWIAKGKLDECYPILVRGLGYSRGGPRWLLQREAAIEYARKYNATK